VLQYVAAGKTLTDGQMVPAQATISGFEKVSLGDEIAGENRTDGVLMGSQRAISSSTGAATSSNAGALATNAIVKAAPGRLYKATVGNGTAGVAGWVMVLDSATLPGNGATPKWRKAIGVTPADVEIDFSAVGGLFCSAGIVIALSTTEATLTIGAATLCVDALYA
jgi:hypothetical protein